MLRIFFLFNFLLLFSPGISQFTKIYSASLDHVWLSIDQKRNIYSIFAGKLYRLSPPYEKSISYTFQNESLPDFIYINDPEKIVLYFQVPHKIILLDSSFTEIIRPFYMDELGLSDISMVFPSTDNGLWFYNYFNNSLTKLNNSFIPVIRSQSLSQYFQPPNVPNFFLIFENKIYINIPFYGILVLNQNGEYITAHQLPGLIDFQIDQKAIYFYRDNIIYCYNYRTLKIKKVYIPFEPETINAWFFENQILILKKDGFSIYQHNINPIDTN